VARELTIGGRVINDESPCYVIAEIGSNHGGSLDVAQQMVEEAARCGASAAKFQKRHNETLYTKAVLEAPYANENSYGPTYGAHRSALEFTEGAFNALLADPRVPVFATAFDERSVDLLVRVGVPAIKIHSGGLSDRPLLRHVSRCGLPVVVSTGGGTLDDIDRAVEALGDCPHALLHCTAAYPLKPEDANLRAILTLRNRYPDTVIGFSSHSPGIAFSLIAYAFGARIIEHHFTLDRAGKGTDNAFSLEPKGLQTLVDDLEKLRLALGDGVKRFLPCELAPLSKMRRWWINGEWKIGTLKEQEPEFHA
jgi:sialic acid synthase